MTDRIETDRHLLTLTAYPAGPGPYEKWEMDAIERMVKEAADAD